MKFCDILAGHTGKVGTNGTHTLGGVKQAYWVSVNVGIATQAVELAL